MIQGLVSQYRVKRVAHFADVGVELHGLVKVDGEGHGVTGGAEAQVAVGVFHGLGEDAHAAQEEAEALLVDLAGVLLAQEVELLGEGGVAEPAAEGGLADAAVAGGLGDGGGGGDDREGALLAVGEDGALPKNVFLIPIYCANFILIQRLPCRSWLFLGFAP